MTPVEAHSHRRPVANEAKAAEAIRDLLKQGILKNVSEPVLWISNSVFREKPDGSLCVFIDHSQTIKSFCLREWGRLGNEGKSILLKIGTHSYCEDLCNMPKF